MPPPRRTISFVEENKRNPEANSFWLVCVAVVPPDRASQEDGQLETTPTYVNEPKKMQSTGMEVAEARVDLATVSSLAVTRLRCRYHRLAARQGCNQWLARN